MIDYKVDADGIATITWNMTDRSMNVLNDSSIPAFAEKVTAAIKDPAVKGVIVTSAKDDFIAGADLTMLQKQTDPAAMIAPLPILAPSRIVVLAPIHTSSPISTPPLDGAKP